MDNIEEKYFLTRGKAILFGFILIVAIVVFIFIKADIGSTKKYKDFETELVNAATNYVDIENISINIGEEKRLLMRDILSVYTTDNKLKDKCSGYVMMVSEKNITTDKYETIFRPYIKCGSRYITSNYSEY